MKIKKTTDEQIGTIMRFIVVGVLIVLSIMALTSCERPEPTNKTKSSKGLTAFEVISPPNGQIIMLNDSLKLWRAGPLIILATSLDSEDTEYKIWGVLREKVPANYHDSYTYMPRDSEYIGDSLTSTTMIEYLVVKRLIL